MVGHGMAGGIDHHARLGFTAIGQLVCNLVGLGASSLSTLRLRRGGGWASGAAASHASEKEERGAVSTISPGYITAT
jgi:hypothetical protein